MSNGSRGEAAEGYTDKAEVSAKIPCPECGADHTRRLQRKGFLQMRIYPIFGYYPWFCPDCKSNFMLRRRHRRKSKRKGE